MSELLESVKRMAKAQKTKNHHAVALEKALGSDAQTQAYNESEAADILFDEEVDAVDMDALAKHLARLERVEVVAKEYRKRYLAHTDHTSIHVLMAGDALDAALSENPDVE